MTGELFIVGVILGALAIYALAWWLELRERKAAKHFGESFTSGYDIDAYYRSEQDYPE